jgi:FkbM family methyltransferase
MRLPEPVKRLTNPLVGRVPVPIMSGPNRGMWWSLASAGSGYMTGRRAARQMELVATLLSPGDVFWDVGAHHGFVSLCASTRVGSTGEVHAFEPSQRNQWFISHHLGWNKIDNVTVHPYALSSYDGTCTFGGPGTSKTLTLGKGTDIVEVRTGSGVIESGAARSPSIAKLDVEGAEADVLGGVMEALHGDSILLIAVHSREAYAGCSALLGEKGYSILPSRALRASIDGIWRSDPDMLCVGPDHATGLLTQRLLRQFGFE